MGESFNIYEFLNMMKNITPEELMDMLLLPFCILLTALCIGQFINSLVENRLAKHFADREEISLKYILLKAAPSAQNDSALCGTTSDMKPESSVQ